jgi:hypothetical protein
MGKQFDVILALFVVRDHKTQTFAYLQLDNDHQTHVDQSFFTKTFLTFKQEVLWIVG